VTQYSLDSTRRVSPRARWVPPRSLRNHPETGWIIPEIVWYARIETGPPAPGSCKEFAIILGNLV